MSYPSLGAPRRFDCLDNLMIRRKKILIVFLLALVPSLCYWEVFRGDLLLPTDWVYRDLEPWRRLQQPEDVVNTRIKDAMLASYALDIVSAQPAREGNVLLWNRFAGGGMPHLAGGFSRMLYPPFWIYAILPSATARNAEILLHLFLASLFAFCFLLRVGANLYGAFLGGVIFGLTPSIIHRAEMSFQLPSIIWFPLLLYFVESIARSGRIVHVVGLGIAVALQFHAGYYPDIFINCLGAGVYGVVRALTSCRFRDAIQRIFFCLSAVALGLALAAPFLLPSLDLILQANRPVTSASRLATTGLGWESLVTAFTPWVQRSSLFVGIAALVFVPLAFRKRTRSVALSLSAVMLTGIAIAAGTPLLALLEALVPPVKNLRYVHTLISIGSFGLALLAGLGISNFFRSGSRSVLLGARIALGAVVAAAALLWRGVGADLLSQFQLPIALTALVLLVLALEVRHRRTLPRWGLALLFLAPISVELVTYARRVNPRVDPGRFPPFPEFDSIRFLRDDPDLFRTAPLLRNYNSPYWPNTLGAYGIEDVGAYHSLIPSPLGRYMDTLQRHAGGQNRTELLEDRDSSGNWMALHGYRHSNLLRIWNIKYFLLPMGWENPDPVSLELAFDGDVRAFRLRDWLPRAWLAQDALVVSGERGAYAKALASSFNPVRTVILEEEPTCSFSRPGTAVSPGSKPTVEIKEYAAERIELETSAPHPAYLFLSQTYDPGWKAEIDDEPFPLLRANVNFQAVALAAGRHRVVLRYQPSAYRWGWLAFSLGAVVVLAGALPFAGCGTWRGWLLVLGSFIPVTVATAGWGLDRVEAGRRVCGQLQVASRLSGEVKGEPLALSNGTLLGDRIEIPEARRWPAHPAGPSMLRFRLARFTSQGAREVVFKVSGLDSDRRSLDEGVVGPGLRRWLHRDIPIPPGSDTIELEVASSTTATEPTSSALAVGAPMLLVPRPRLASVVFFSTGSGRAGLDLSSLGPERLRILLHLGEVPAELAAQFDVSYSSPTEEELGERLLALAQNLYRVSTVLVVKVEHGSARPEFGKQQLALFRAELDRLGLTDEDVELTILDEAEALPTGSRDASVPPGG